ncbi:MAG: precorrin-8X methylmutase [Euryarchaeota archaeon]|nr:precorrin-8X methylmutase [Euryarchaeota archaeon]
MNEAERIELESMRQIERMLSAYRMPEREVVKRVVHATAEPELAEEVVFHRNAVHAGVEAIRSGCSMVTDVEMVACGIKKHILRSFGGEVRCYISSEDVRRYAKLKGITRARASVALHADEIDGSIFVSGNSPTALEEVLELCKPRFIIAACVGFVGAAEVKERVLESEIPAIVLRGRRGGSGVAAAIANALLLLARSRACAER